jgi:nucleotide-binding universal stress UspA family protein
MKKPSIRNILVPIDFSKMSIQAIKTAKHLAQRFGAAVHLGHVSEFYYPAGFVAPGMPPPVAPIISPDAEARGLTRALRALAHEHEIPAERCHLLKGIPAFNEICRLAREIKADLIVMPTHGRTGLKHIFLGSTAERIVQYSPCPVFVARQFRKRPGSAKIDKILVPVDFSGCSLRGLKYAIRWGEKFAARILVLHAADPGMAFTSDGYAMYDLSKYREMKRKEAKRQMEKFVRLAKFGGVKFETAVLVGRPVDEITAFAQNRDVDLIISGTHGRTGFKHVLIGSVAELIVRHAHCPVLVAPSHPEFRRQLVGRAVGVKTIPQKRHIASRPLARSELLTRRNGKLARHAFPERRRTNKFRESHFVA